jgi:putative peptidoglycan lipid II flippase
MRDGRTPTLINLCMVAVKVAIVLVCANLFDDPAKVAVALTTATSASYVVGALVGHVALTRRLGRLGFARVLSTVARVTVASALAAAAAFGVALAMEHLLGSGRAGAAAMLSAGGIVGLVVLVVALGRMRLDELRTMAAVIRR